MSDIVERTLASLPSIPGLISGKKSGSSTRGFQNFINSLGTLKTKYDEEQCIQKELALQKQKLAQPSLTTGQIRESLVRLLYCDMLGYDVSFCYMYGIKLAQQGSLLEKRAGYIVCSLFLHEDHELVIMLINTIQKDLKSTNVLNVCTALVAVTQLISTEMIPAILPLVEEKLNHPKEIVRKKAVLCLQHFLQKSPHHLPHIEPYLKKALCDKDVGVMWAVLHCYHDLVKLNPVQHRYLTPNLVNVIQQILARKLPGDYEYHTIPVPWLQILILNILAKLGAGDERTSQAIYPVVKEVMQKIDPSHKIGLAILYECMETATSILPHPALTEHVAKCVAKFLTSKSSNLRYLGLKALSSVVQIDPGYAVPHQEVVIDCLEHNDITIRRKTLDLLYKMANGENVKVICSKMLDNLAKSTDQYLKVEIVNQVLDLTERFMSDIRDYIDTINRVIVLARDLMPMVTSQKVINVIQKGTKNQIPDDEVRIFAVNCYWELLQQDDLPETTVQIGSWVLGTYSMMCKDLNLSEIIRQLVVVFRRPATSCTSKSWILTALIKLSSHLKKMENVLLHLEEAIKKEDSDLHQRLKELRKLTVSEKDYKDIAFQKEDLLSTEHERFDFSLSFLDDYVAESLELGAKPYVPPGGRNAQIQKPKELNAIFAGLKFAPYDNSQGNSNSGSSMYSEKVPDYSPSQSHSSGTTPDGKPNTNSKLNLKGVKKVWTKEGIIKKQKEFKELKLPEHDQNKTENQENLVKENKLDEKSKKKEEKKALADALFSGIKSQVPLEASEKMEEKVNNTLPGDKKDLPFDSYGGSKSVYMSRKEDLDMWNQEGNVTSKSLSSSLHDDSEITGNTGFNLIDMKNQSDNGITGSMYSSALTSVGSMYTTTQETKTDQDDLEGNVKMVETTKEGAFGEFSKKSSIQQPSMYHNYSVDPTLDLPSSPQGGARGGFLLEDMIRSPSDGQIGSMYEGFPTFDSSPMKDDLHALQSEIVTQRTGALDDENNLVLKTQNDDDILSETDSIEVEATDNPLSNLQSIKTKQPENETSTSSMAGPKDFSHNRLVPATLPLFSKESSPLGSESFETDSLDSPTDSDNRHLNFRRLLSIAKIPANLMDDPHEKEPSLVGQTHDIIVYCQKVWLSDSLCVVLYILKKPTCDSVLNNVELVITDPGNLDIQRENETSGDVQNWPIQELATKESVILQLKVNEPKEDDISFCKCDLRNNAVSLLEFSLPVTVTDFLRPVIINEEEFGQKWTNLQHEQKLTIKCLQGFKEIEQVKEKFREMLHVSCIQVIGNEAILSGEFLCLPRQLLLCHIRIASGLVIVVLKTESRTRLNAIAQSLEQ